MFQKFLMGSLLLVLGLGHTPALTGMAPNPLNFVTQEGVRFKVHPQASFVPFKGQQAYARKVLHYSKKAYSVLKHELSLDEFSEELPKTIDIYLNLRSSSLSPSVGSSGWVPSQGSPSFTVYQDASSGETRPVIFMPADYKSFLQFWKKVNPVPHRIHYPEDAYLANSIIHELTHVFTHVLNENLGSTEKHIHTGDWYTEGLARYFETKMESDASFASEGFREITGDTLRFSRGGANYYLRYPDESFFGLRYENALFWLYFEKRFGSPMIVRLSRQLGDTSFEATPQDYMRVLEKTTGIPFREMLHDYFTWIYEERYKTYHEGRHLLSVAKTSHAYSGKSLEISTDTQDWTPQADIQPLAFDVHEISFNEKNTGPMTLMIRHLGVSKQLKVTLFLKSEDGLIEEKTYTRSQGGVIQYTFDLTEKLSKIGLVLSNLDSHQVSHYEISITPHAPASES